MDKINWDLIQDSFPFAWESKEGTVFSFFVRAHTPENGPIEPWKDIFSKEFVSFIPSKEHPKHTFIIAQLKTMATSTSYFHLPSYLLSRFAFVGTHLVFLYWLNFLLNDPLNLGTNTLDFKPPAPGPTCRSFIWDNFTHDLMLFGLWWGTHSIFARKAFKVLYKIYIFIYIDRNISQLPFCILSLSPISLRIW